MANNIKEFVGRIERQIYSSDNYKMYALNVERDKYPDIKFSKFGNAIIGGNLHSLSQGMEYFIKAKEKNDSRGYMYEVLNIRKTDLNTEADVYDFLQEILTFNQASQLYQHYPNIVELVMTCQTDKVDLSKLKGIKEYTFCNIKEKIIENFALFDLINEFGGVLTMNIMKKLYNKYPSIEKIRIELQNHPYTTLCSISGVGFRTADSLLLDMEKQNKLEFPFDLITSKERCMACIIYLLEDNEQNGNTKMKIPELRKQVMKLVPKCSHHFVSCLNSSNDIFYDKKTMDISLMITHDIEYRCYCYLKNAQTIKYNWDINWKEYQNKGEYPLTDEQIKTLELVCNNQVSILCGFAGSGKTATTNTLIRLLHENYKTFMLLSPTGRASKVLASYTGEEAATIHRGYGYTPMDGWCYNNENKVPVDIVICDESSMCDIFLFYRLIDAIDFEKTKLLIIGDPAQLCSVAAGNVLNDLIASNYIPIASLTKIFRYGEGGLMQVATDTRNGQVFLNKKSNQITFFGANKDYGFWNCNNDNIIDNLLKLYRTILNKNNPEDIMVLTSQNKGTYGTIEINNKLQKIANKNYGKGDVFKVGETSFYKDDIVMQTVNNYRSKLYFEDEVFGEFEREEVLIANGELGVVKEITNKYIIIDFDGTLVKYTNADMQTVQLGYCLTTHKSQGGSAPIVIVLSPSAHTFMMSSNLLYVALTRTKTRCFHLGDISTINRAVKKKENLNRETFLCDFFIRNEEIK